MVTAIDLNEHRPRTPTSADRARMLAEAAEMAEARTAHAERTRLPVPTGVGSDSGILGTLPDVSDHVGEVHGNLTRCAEDGELWPCSAITQAKRLLAMPVALLEMVDVGWYLAAAYPEQLDPPPRRVRGVVAGYRDDEDRGRIFTLVGAAKVAGRPAVRQLAAREVDPRLDEAMPYGPRTRDAYRLLAEHVGKGTGTGDGTDVKYLSLALALCQAST